MQLPLLYEYACTLGASIEHTIVVSCLTGAGRNAAWPLPKSEICRAALGAQSANDPRAGQKQQQRPHLRSVREKKHRLATLRRSLNALGKLLLEMGACSVSLLRTLVLKAVSSQRTA